MTGSRADRLDRPLFDLEAGRRHTPTRSPLTKRDRGRQPGDARRTRLVPIRHTIKRAVISPVGSPPAQSASRSGGVPVRVPRHALSENGSVAEQPDTIPEEGSDDHNPDQHQDPRTHSRPSPRRRTPPSLRPGPTRRCHPPRTGPFQATAHPRIAQSNVGPKSNGAAHGRPVPLHPYAQPEGVGRLIVDLHFPNANTRATAQANVGLALACRPRRQSRVR